MKRRNIFCFSAAIAGLTMLFAAAASMAAASTGHGAGQTPHWGYDGPAGPARWGGLSTDFALCGIGASQSPVNIAHAVPGNMGPIEFHYNGSPLRIVNNGHTIQVNYEPGSYIVVEGQRYDLLQFHFHSPSENQVAGRPYDMEAHFVHKDSQGRLGVVGVFLTRGEHNPLMKRLWDRLPREAGPENSFPGVIVNGSELLPDDRSYYHFSGSLTTPPCTEAVNWYVLKTPVQVSPLQVGTFVSVIGNNARPVQPLNGRMVVEVAAPPPVSSYAPPSPAVPITIGQGNSGNTPPGYGQAQHASPMPASPAAYSSQPVNPWPNPQSMQGAPTHASPGKGRSAATLHGAQQYKWGAGTRAVTLLEPSKLARLDSERRRAIDSSALFDFSQIAHSGTKALWILAIVGVAALTLLIAGARSRFLAEAKLATKLYSGFGVVVAVALAIGLCNRYFLNIVGEESHMAEDILEAEVLAAKLTTLQNEFLLLGIEDRKLGEEILQEHGKTTDELHQTFEATMQIDLDAAETSVMNKISEANKKYESNFAVIVAKYHEIEEIKEQLDKEGEEMEVQIDSLLKRLEAELVFLEANGASLEEVAAQSELVEKIVKIEVQSLKLSHYEMEFLLEKHIAVVPSMETSLSELYGGLEQTVELLENSSAVRAEKAEDLRAVRAIEEQTRQYQNQLAMVIEDELSVEASALNATEIIARMESTLEQFADIGKEHAAAAKSTANAASLGAIILALLSGGLLSLLICHAVLTQLGGEPAVLVEISRKIATGDLRVSFNLKENDNNSLFASMKQMVAKLKGVIAEVSSSADNVSYGSQELSSTSEEMSSTAEQLSQGATEQAASVEEVSSSMEQMASNIQQNAANAIETERIARKTAADAREGGQAVSETTHAMKEIAGKISIIEEIARQTNLLALNAAIEAARAGEHGKGFAVVASEVRKLAERSQLAAGEISELSTSSVEIAEKAGEMLTRIVPDIQKTAELVQEITAACTEQASGAEQVNKAIQQLDVVIQQNAAGSEEMSSSSEQTAAMAEELSSQSEQLMRSISYFKLEKEKKRKEKSEALGGSSKTKLPPPADGHDFGHFNPSFSKKDSHATDRIADGVMSPSGSGNSDKMNFKPEGEDGDFEHYS